MITLSELDKLRIISGLQLVLLDNSNNQEEYLMSDINLLNEEAAILLLIEKVKLL